METGTNYPVRASCEYLLKHDGERPAGLRIAVLAAAAIHLTIFAITWPTMAQNERPVIERERDYILLQPVSFERETPVVEFSQTPLPVPEVAVPLPVSQAPVVLERSSPVTRWTAPDFRIVPTMAFKFPPPPPEIESLVVQAGIEIEAPRQVHRVNPRYPAAAKKLRITGSVVLDMLIDVDGRVVDITVLRGQPFGMTESAVDAARQWLFEPSTYRGRPVGVRYTLTVTFHLDSGL